ncbi:hypothetical protein CHS0354_004933 [Potamilus streckersoni]|uniref:Methyltransferase type 11 domain-containing protein n=1 Tax=Potamilus streckersoni TaxID=2493646 RepID=A0AAE0TJ09_9BIVA|nr:hypothetical protein CHS0354_004933 [Potamilus streckersoni]
MEAVHKTAKSGFTQGNEYDQARPSYTDALVQEVLSAIKETEEHSKDFIFKVDILELGAGTGKFTQKILPLFEKNCRYLATEPSEGFLAKLKENCPNIESQIGSAEQISLPDNSVKNVVCAQCFHWFATDVSLKEIHRVLIPGGKLIMIWNHKDWSVPWVEKIEDILNEYYKGVPRALNYDWKTVVENFKGFAFNDHKILPGVHFQGPSDAIIAHYSSLSVIASLDPTSKAAVLDKIRSIIQEADLAFDNINIPMKSEMYCCHKE